MVLFLRRGWWGIGPAVEAPKGCVKDWAGLLIAAGVAPDAAAVVAGWLVDVAAEAVAFGAVMFPAVEPVEDMAGPPNMLEVAAGAAVLEGVEVLGGLGNNEGVVPGVVALVVAEPRPENKPFPPALVVVAFDCPGPGFVPKDGNVEELVAEAEVLFMPVNRLEAVPVVVEGGLLVGCPTPVPNMEVGLGPVAAGA